MNCITSFCVRKLNNDTGTVSFIINKKAVLSQGNRAMPRILPTPNDASIVIISLPRIIYTLPIFRPKFPGVPFGVDLCCLLLVSVERKKA